MAGSLIVTVFPVVFLVLLFGGGTMMRRRNIDIDGEPPIGRGIFYASKYAILGLWGATVAQSWGLDGEYWGQSPIIDGEDLQLGGHLAHLGFRSSLMSPG